MKITNINNMPTMSDMCPTCPFREEHEGQVEIANRVRKRCLTKASQICHHPALKGKKQTHLCFGARNFQLQIFYRLGFIEAETDAAWKKKFNEIRGK